MLGRKIIEKNGTEKYQKEGKNKMEKKVVQITGLILLVITILGIVLNLPKAIALTQKEVDTIFGNNNIIVGNSEIKIDSGWLNNEKTIDYETFRTAKNMFCINEGAPYDSDITFRGGFLISVIGKDIFYYDYVGKTWKKYEDEIKEGIENGTDVELDEEKIYGISYILSKIEENTETKVSVPEYTLQQAIWIVLGQVEENSCTEYAKELAEHANNYAASGSTKNINAIFYILDAGTKGQYKYLKRAPNLTSNEEFIYEDDEFYFGQSKFSKETLTNKYTLELKLHNHIRYTIRKLNNGKFELSKEWKQGGIGSYETFIEPEQVQLKTNSNGAPYQNIVIGKAVETESIAPPLTINIIKTDAETDLFMEGVKFEVDIGGAGLDIKEYVTDKNGKATITINNMNLGIAKMIEITEIETNNGYILPGDYLNLKIYYNSQGKCWELNNTHKEMGGINDLLEIERHNEDTFKLNIKNEKEEDEKITLSGYVWLDEQRGTKPVRPINGTFETDEVNLDTEVKVELFDAETSALVDTMYTTNKYEFKNIPKKEYGYYIRFTYDGINYKTTVQNTDSTKFNVDSDATEIGRDAFNAKFHRIEKGYAYKEDTDDTKTALSYTYNDTAGTATLNVNNKDGKVKDVFAMKAEASGPYKTSKENINLGLVEKGVDLSAYTSVKSAKVAIKGEEVTYTGEQDINVILGNKEPTYNLYLYNSDYNYRIEDYNLNELQNQIEKKEQENYIKGLRNNAEEVEVILTYSIILNNESVTPANINKIAYYYNDNLTLINDGEISYEIAEGTFKKDDIAYNKAYITRAKVVEEKNNYTELEISFRVNKDADSGKILLGENKNFVEILSYSTTTGCIDCDSEPGNFEAHPNEDDSDDAPVLNISIKEEERQITGFVFEDLKSDDNQFGNGYFEENTEEKNKKVNDVIVQLIEIKDVTIGETSQRLEYIWQETVSGSNKVKYVTTDGKNISTYPVVNSDGEYQFKEFIPGNYIVRFIYGDGTYYDTAINGESTTNTAKANILKYNGQDYKSAIDLGYNNIGYDGGYYGYIGCVRFENDDSSANSQFYLTNLSKARDNEARRLEEMAYATSVTDVSNLIIDSKDKLKDTWMCAETSIVGVPVETNTGKFAENNINFGLILRPQTSYTLEKHITKLKVDGIADVEVAKDESGNYIFENGLLGYTDSIGGLVLATATAKNVGIGKWTIETDLNNIRGGISITYGYKITRSGEGEYIGKALQEALNIGTTYGTLASDLKEEQRNPFTEYILGTYLGTAYYLGEIGTDVNAGGGLSSVKIEDYLSSNAKRALQIKNDEFTSVGNADKKVWLDTTNEAIEKVNVIQSKPITFGEDGTAYVELSLRKDIIDTTTEKDGLTYRSYAAQLVPAEGNIVSLTGVVTLGNLQYVQAYTDNFPVIDLVPEDDEFIAETVLITKSTGGIDPNGN